MWAAGCYPSQLHSQLPTAHAQASQLIVDGPAIFWHMWRVPEGCGRRTSGELPLRSNRKWELVSGKTSYLSPPKKCQKQKGGGTYSRTPLQSILEEFWQDLVTSVLEFSWMPAKCTLLLPEISVLTRQNRYLKNQCNMRKPDRYLLFLLEYSTVLVLMISQKLFFKRGFYFSFGAFHCIDCYKTRIGIFARYKVFVLSLTPFVYVLPLQYWAKNFSLLSLK